MISITKPKFSKTSAHLEKMMRFDPKNILEEYGKIGVAALSKATPVDTGETASQWSYKVVGNRQKYRLIWSNDEMAGSVPLVVILHYGHANRDGSFTLGVDFINPALKPVYQALGKRLVQEVIR